MTATSTTTTVSISREAAGVAGVAWAYLAALTRGSGGRTQAAGILPAFREIYNDNYSAVLDACVSVGLPNADPPRTLRPSSTLTDSDVTALMLSLYPYVEISRLAGESRWGDAEALLDRFDAESNEEALRTWFLDQLASVWPQGSSNRHAQQLWWFASNVSSADSANAIFVQYVFQGRDDAGYVSATSSIQDAAAAATMPTELPGVEITASASWRRPTSLVWILAAIFGSIAISSLGLWWYRRRYGRLPWQRGRS